MHNYIFIFTGHDYKWEVTAKHIGTPEEAARDLVRAMYAGRAFIDDTWNVRFKRQPTKRPIAKIKCLGEYESF